MNNKVKNTILLLALMQCSVLCNGQANPVTIYRSFIRKANSCKIKYVSGGIGCGEVDVFCAKEQFDLNFCVKNDSTELYVDDSIFQKKGSVRLSKLTENYSMYDQFDCYAFAYPHRGRRPNIDVPVVVLVYKRIKDDTWQYLTKINAKNSRELENTYYQIIRNKYEIK